MMHFNDLQEVFFFHIETLMSLEKQQDIQTPTFCVGVIRHKMFS